MGADHGRSPVTSAGGKHRRALAWVLGLVLAFVGVEIAAGLLTGSLTLLADAGHMATDALGVGMALAAVTAARRAARNPKQTFGHYRWEVLAALANATLLLGVAAYVTVEGVGRLRDPVEVDAVPMLAVAVVGLVVNLVSFRLLHSGAKESLNVRGAYLEVMGDLLGSVAVIAAAVVILLTGWLPADAIASLAIAAMIVPRAVGLLREVVTVLSESVPRGVQVQTIRDHILATAGVRAVHDVHVWQLTRGAPVFSAHVVVDPEALASGGSGRILTELQECLADHFDVEHSTFQLESASHVDGSAHA